LIDM